MLSSQCFQSLASSLILLLVTLYETGVPRKGTLDVPPNNHQTYHPDVVLLKQVIEHFLTGSLGDLEEDSLEEEYGVEHSPTDRNDPDGIRRALFIEVLVNCLENSPASAAVLLDIVISVSSIQLQTNIMINHQKFQEYWQSPGTGLTNLYAAICIRRINTFCRFALIHFQPHTAISQTSESYQSPRTLETSTSTSHLSFDTATPPGGALTVIQIVSILHSRVVPESELLETISDPPVILQTKTNVARVLLNLLCENDGLGYRSQLTSPSEDVFADGNQIGVETEHELKRSIGWVTDTLAAWYKSNTSSPWKEALENTLRQVVSVVYGLTSRFG